MTLITFHSACVINDILQLLKHVVSLTIMNWAQCEDCDHWTHLRYCSPVNVVSSKSVFRCPTVTANEQESQSIISLLKIKNSLTFMHICCWLDSLKIKKIIYKLYSLLNKFWLRTYFYINKNNDIYMYGWNQWYWCLQISWIHFFLFYL